MTPAEAFALSEALSLLRWQKNKPKGPFADEVVEDESEEPREEYRQPLTMDQQAQENGVGGMKRWM